jgi:hypothetical protein
MTSTEKQRQETQAYPEKILGGTWGFFRVRLAFASTLSQALTQSPHMSTSGCVSLSRSNNSSRPTHCEYSRKPHLPITCSMQETNSGPLLRRHCWRDASKTDGLITTSFFMTKANLRDSFDKAIECSRNPQLLKQYMRQVE